MTETKKRKIAEQCLKDAAVARELIDRVPSIVEKLQLNRPGYTLSIWKEDQESAACSYEIAAKIVQDPASVSIEEAWKAYGFFKDAMEDLQDTLNLLNEYNVGPAALIRLHVRTIEKNADLLSIVAEYLEAVGEKTDYQELNQMIAEKDEDPMAEMAARKQELVKDIDYYQNLIKEARDAMEYDQRELENLTAMSSAKK